MIDNVLYQDTSGLIMDIDVSNSGSAAKVLYKDTKGFTQNISMVHTGSITSVLYPKEVLEIIKPSNTYSRSRVVNK